MQEEQWRPVVGFEGFYEVSDQGRVKSLERVVIRSTAPQTVRERILKPATLSSGHLHVVLHGNGARRTMRIHQMVMHAFVGPTPSGMEICHNNGLHTDNRLENLRFDTHAANMEDLSRKLLQNRKSHCVNGHEYTPENSGFSEDGRRRYCRRCKTIKSRQWHARQLAKDPAGFRRHNADRQLARRKHLRESAANISPS